MQIRKRENIKKENTQIWKYKKIKKKNNTIFPYFLFSQKKCCFLCFCVCNVFRSQFRAELRWAGLGLGLGWAGGGCARRLRWAVLGLGLGLGPVGFSSGVEECRGWPSFQGSLRWRPKRIVAGLPHGLAFGCREKCCEKTREKNRGWGTCVFYECFSTHIFFTEVFTAFASFFSDAWPFGRPGGRIRIGVGPGWTLQKTWSRFFFFHSFFTRPAC